MSFPSSSTRPSSAGSYPAAMRSVVVFPDPDAPTSARSSPSATVTVTWSTAGGPFGPPNRRVRSVRASEPAPDIVPLAPVANVGIPVGHPTIETVGQHRPIHRHRLQLLARRADPFRQRVVIDVGARGNPQMITGRGQQQRLACHELVERARGVAVMR